MIPTWLAHATLAPPVKLVEVACVCLHVCVYCLPYLSLSPTTQTQYFVLMCVSVSLCAPVCMCVWGHPPAVLLLLNDPCSAWELGVSQRRD